MSDRKPLIVFAVFLAIMGGVVFMTMRGDESDKTPTASVDETSIESTTTSTTARHNGTTTPSVSVPTTAPNATSDQWRAIFGNLIGLQNALLQKPDPSRVDEIMDPACSCYSETRQALKSLSDKQWHVQGEFVGISSTALISKTDKEIRIAATLSGIGNPTVDAQGKTQSTSPRGPLQPMLYTLKQQSAGNWVISDRQSYEER